MATVTTYPSSTLYPGVDLFPGWMEVPDPPALGFDVRLRLYTPSGTRGRVLPALSFGITTPASETPTLRAAVSEAVAGILPEPFVVAVEYSNRGGAWVEPRNGRFVMSQDSADAATPEGVVTYTGSGLVPWLMGKALAAGASQSTDIEYTNATAGGILLPLVNAAKARGWGAGITTDFSATTDSLGQAWPAGDKVSLTVRPESTLSGVLNAIAGVSEWWTEGMKLRLAKPGSGTDRSATVRIGLGAQKVPVRSSFDDVATHMLVIPEDAGRFELANAGAITDFGRLEAALTQSGVADQGTATRLAQPHLELARTAQRESSITYAAPDAPALPWVDYQVGDVVRARIGTGWQNLRVEEIVVARDSEGAISVTAVLAYRFRPLLARLTGRVGGASVGTVVGGTGAPLPPSSTPFLYPPKPPTGLSVTANEGYWGDGNVPHARLDVTWAAVTQGVDDGPINIAGYRVWVAYGDGEWSQLASTTAPAVSLDQLAPGTVVHIKVAAVSTATGISDESGVLTVTAATPIVTPTAPTSPNLVSRLGLAVAIWDGQLVGGAPTPSLSHVIAEWSDSQTGTFTAFGAPLTGQGSVSLSGRSVGSTVWVRFVAVSRDDVRSVPSTVESVVIVGVTGPDIEAGSVRAVHIEAGAITANELSPSVGTDLDISANGTVTIIAGAAQDATAAADSAQAAADAALGAADAANEGLASMQTYYAFGADGAVISKPGSPFAVAVRNDRIEMLESGGVVSYWNSGQMVVKQLVGERVILGNHQIEKSTTGTVVRALT